MTAGYRLRRQAVSVVKVVVLVYCVALFGLTALRGAGLLRWWAVMLTVLAVVKLVAELLKLRNGDAP